MLTVKHTTCHCLHVPRTDGNPDENFAVNVRVARERRGWSQAEFSQKLRDAGLTNFHQTTVSRVEKGERVVRLGEAQVIAATLGTLVDFLTTSPRERHWANMLGDGEQMISAGSIEVSEGIDKVLRGSKYLEFVLERIEDESGEWAKGDGLDTVREAREALLNSSPEQVLREAITAYEIRKDQADVETERWQKLWEEYAVDVEHPEEA